MNAARRIMTLLAVVVVSALPAMSAVPHTIAYQGTLSDSNGTPVNTTVPMGFAIFSAATGGTPLWSEGPVSVAVNKGVFRITLGQVVPIASSVFAAADRWLEISPNGTPLAPRQKLASMPFSMNADQLNGLGANELIAAASGGADPSILVTMVGVGNCPAGYTFFESGTAYYPVCATGSATCAGAFSAARAVDLIVCSPQTPSSTAFISLNTQCALCLRGTP